ncbi:hypothetical protein LCGC14_0567860 [marine sediment metagenome]|uniref:ERF family protein n=1 Tax=marine sediment metagenome TaxID=412755 RepID=A0A0F9U6F5_9ZZZZ
MEEQTKEPEDQVLEAELVDDVDESSETLEAEAIDADPDEDPGVALMRILGDAVSSGVDVEVIERLLAVHERYQAGLARQEYNAAVSALRADLPEVVKTEIVDYPTKKAGRVSYRHEALATMVEDLSPVMAQHGLSFRWSIEQDTPDLIKVTCIVTHAAGHSEEASLFGPPDTTGSKNAIQAIASTVSYLQRYTLKAAIGIAAGKDDDGAGGAPAQQRPLEQPRAQGQEPGAGANGPGDVLEVEELHEVMAMFPGDREQTISTTQQGRLYNFASKNGWRREDVDNEVVRVLSMRASEIPSLGDAYEATVRWFQTHGPIK